MKLGVSVGSLSSLGAALALSFGALNLWRVGEHEKAMELAERALGQDQEAREFVRILLEIGNGGPGRNAVDPDLRCERLGQDRGRSRQGGLR